MDAGRLLTISSGKGHSRSRLRRFTLLAAMLRLAKHPVISVNGNVAALAPDGLIELGQVLNAPLEVNIFHTETGREQKIREYLLQHGATGCPNAYNRGTTLLYRL